MSDKGHTQCINTSGEYPARNGQVPKWSGVEEAVRGSSGPVRRYGWGSQSQASTSAHIGSDGERLGGWEYTVRVRTVMTGPRGQGTESGEDPDGQGGAMGAGGPGSDGAKLEG
jgi:hypothetical protein